jgi:ABC-type uncharacterized transport system permease subunit
LNSIYQGDFIRDNAETSLFVLFSTTFYFNQTGAITEAVMNKEQIHRYPSLALAKFYNRLE